MADRDTLGTGEPNRKTPDPMANSGLGNDRSQNRGSSDDLNRMAGEAADAGRDTLGAAQGRIRSLLETQTDRAADQLGSVANALHKAAEQLNEENNGTAAHYAGQAADRVERVADMLRNSTVDDMVGQVERFARRQPEVFVGAAFAVGFLFARFVKSSGERRFRGASSSHLTGGYARHDRGYSGRDQDHHDYRDFGLRGADRAGQEALRTDHDLAGRRRTGTGGIGGATSTEGPGAARPRSGLSSGMTSATAITSAGGGIGRNQESPRPLNTATAATTAARTRDAAEMVAGTTPGSTQGSTTESKPVPGNNPIQGIKP
ncbi:hypothetical protein Sp245p_16040 (plasmid) [Azospirillum baldaniorum]|uniref:Uncharacterized protein n=1 Tax=Azospirillum baldaniorum TaxID=1064539 RepID=A0A9P1NN99_9PROT|nr:hypothetical protein [Azospirillum baldaniorum]AWJ91356.1 hypothetical protein Sp245p_16040 [Azospirillum baldaniorum]TWA83792.1 hypothetical protein FBZ85_101541 [Azospirillum brasilense]CCC99625.1 conserved protein of unknown function [Azospirillum baldaniorum]